ncbi:MAG: hypothetical protein EHM70_01615 [Chloroflexota bacterium]|nr:MAG: hypothetical protein EHM70_01615 [Chloroflexota bacterium]
MTNEEKSTIGSDVAAVTGDGTLPLDNGTSHDGRYQYSFETGAGAIGIYGINNDGSLSFVGLDDGLAVIGGYAGIAVR